MADPVSEEGPGVLKLWRHRGVLRGAELLDLCPSDIGPSCALEQITPLSTPNVGLSRVSDEMLCSARSFGG